MIFCLFFKIRSFILIYSSFMWKTLTVFSQHYEVPTIAALFYRILNSNIYARCMLLEAFSLNFM